MTWSLWPAGSAPGGPSWPRWPPLRSPVPTRARGVQRRALGVDPGDTLVLTVTRLAPQKNLGLLLDIAAAVRERPDLRFAVVGDGPLHEELAARVVADGSHVSLLGRQDDIASLLGAADVALLTSTWEARALVAQEALLSGVPLVSSRVGGIPELVGDAAVLVDLDRPTSAVVDDAVRALLTLADDPEAREGLRLAGLAQAATWPDEDDVADALIASYRSLI